MNHDYLELRIADRCLWDMTINNELDLFDKAFEKKVKQLFEDGYLLSCTRWYDPLMGETIFKFYPTEKGMAELPALVEGMR